MPGVWACGSQIRHDATSVVVRRSVMEVVKYILAVILAVATVVVMVAAVISIADE